MPWIPLFLKKDQWKYHYKLFKHFNSSLILTLNLFGSWFFIEIMESQNWGKRGSFSWWNLDQFHKNSTKRFQISLYHFRKGLNEFRDPKKKQINGAFASHSTWYSHRNMPKNGFGGHLGCHLEYLEPWAKAILAPSLEIILRTYRSIPESFMLS